MALPVRSNTTCDIYRVGNTPPAAPDVAGVACNLKAYFMMGLERGEGGGTTQKFDHILLVDYLTDIRDDWSGGVIGGNADAVYIPDKNGTGFKVVYVEMLFPGRPGQHKKVFLSRQAPNWPSNNL